MKKLLPLHERREIAKAVRSFVQNTCRIPNLMGKDSGYRTSHVGETSSHILLTFTPDIDPDPVLRALLSNYYQASVVDGNAISVNINQHPAESTTPTPRHQDHQVDRLEHLAETLRDIVVRTSFAGLSKEEIGNKIYDAIEMHDIALIERKAPLTVTPGGIMMATISRDVFVEILANSVL